MKTHEQYEMFESALAAMPSALRERVEKMIANAARLEIVFRECGKVKYGHKETAEQAVIVMRDKTGDAFEAYQCVWCGNAWHIGHAKDKED